MPHMILKISDDLTDEVKENLLEVFEKDLITIAGKKTEEISIDIVKIAKENWKEVYEKDVLPNMNRLDKKPGYKM